MQIDDYVVHIVDDEEPVRKSLAFLLTITGFTVRVHDSATSFLAAAPGLGKACLVARTEPTNMADAMGFHV
jgi:two-component system response regulator FixJ